MDKTQFGISDLESTKIELYEEKVRAVSLEIYILTSTKQELEKEKNNFITEIFLRNNIKKEDFDKYGIDLKEKVIKEKNANVSNSISK